MQKSLLFGTESEYAIHPPEAVKSFVIERALERLNLKHIGGFLENGSRAYCDTGCHPEIATPECTTPWELVRYVKAGDQILGDAVRDLPLESAAIVSYRPFQISEIEAFRYNLDYCSGATWGCHESYLTTRNLVTEHESLIPHLVTRPIYCGAGGFSRNCPSYSHFSIAPRLLEFSHIIAESSTACRPIIHIKNETLSHGYHRLHFICGENLCSEIAIALKVGTTALIVHLIDLGWSLPDNQKLSDPISNLHKIVVDPICKSEITTTNGKHTTALQVQFALLETVSKHLSSLPSWAPDICKLWESVLLKIEQGPDSVATILDWAIKRRLYLDRADRLGIKFGSEMLPSDVVADFVHADIRFGQLGGSGIFDQLDRAGVLGHRLPTTGDIQAAMHTPPQIGRAKLRGETIRHLADTVEKTKVLAAADWWVVRIGTNYLDLSDPFAQEAKWGPLPIR